GHIIEPFMEAEEVGDKLIEDHRRKIIRYLAKYNYVYLRGQISSAGHSQLGSTFSSLIEKDKLVIVKDEFQRLLNSVEADPEVAVTSSCSLLESLFKLY